jgi:hypothetical protein
VPTLRSAPSILSARISASQLGCTNDCDLDTGLTPSGGAPFKGNAQIINAWLAAFANSSTQIGLLLDCACLLNTSIVIPAGCNVEITGLGWHTGFFMAVGANSTCIINHATAPFDPGVVQIAAPTPSGSVRLGNFRIEGNRGTTLSGAGAGNATSPVSVDLRGTSPSGTSGAATYWFCGIDLFNVQFLQIENVKIHNTPLYALRLSNCNNVTLDRVDTYNDWAGVNGDGIHFSGPCRNLRVTGCQVYSHDDATCLNGPEGYFGGFQNAVFTGINVNSGASVFRIYVNAYYNPGTTQSIVYTNFIGNLISYAAFILGIQNVGPSTLSPNQNQDLAISNGVVSMTSAAYCFLMLCNSFGILRVSNVTWANPVAAVPFLALANTGMSVAELIVESCSVHRTTAGNALAGAFDTVYNVQGFGSTNTVTIKRLVIRGYNITNEAGQPFSPLPFLLRIGTGCSIGELWIDSLDPTNITALVDSKHGWTNIASLNGPGVLASGFQIPDAVMANNCPYISATGANAGKSCIKRGGTVHTLNYT